MAFESEKTTLADEVKGLEEALAFKKRRLEKLNAVQEALAVEPAPHSVIRFARTVGGGLTKYTFVAFRASSQRNSWYLTGRSNALRPLGLKETGNTWADVLVAIGDAEVQVVQQWSNVAEEDYDYFVGSNDRRIYRTSERRPRIVEKKLDGGNWVHDPYLTKNFLVSNPGSFPRVDKSWLLGSDSR